MLNTQSFARKVLAMKTVTLNEQGRRVGQSHPRAKLLDSEVELALALLDEGLSLAAVAEKFGVSKGCLWKIKEGHRRCQTVTRVVRVSVDR